jgi:hypothetical protein
MPDLATEDFCKFGAKIGTDLARHVTLLADWRPE